ncbi:CubicO group peptidase (beta-lactamase class C family) [Aeromicrobium panaciterrae]|uniref:CubicO group peptidase (Beta-lactamase class C family) n=1 Tax=Aeromicrobium panaciterrae TaxID=363861 RepID=A0ABU1UM75_9ACTN|nr:serine hydrolase [Aeromicrobium panaciterrae]MDR7086240.1 CubicO group peptidase (beta-lactamase class C family) [Aeromicrobium panaciterrae]
MTADASPTPRHRIRKALVAFAVVIALLVGGLFAYTSAKDMQGPTFIARFLFTRTSDAGTLFDGRTIDAAAAEHPIPESVRPLPSTVQWMGKPLATEKVLKTTKTNSFMVLCRGEVVHEWYAEKSDRTRRQSSWSVAKSVVSLLVGQLIGEGKLTEDTRLVEVLPEFKNGTDFDTITVADLLDMKSGIDVAEDYSYFKPFSGVGGLLMTTDLVGYLKDNRGLRFDPGSKSEYRSVDAQYLSMIASRVDGKPLAEMAKERLWDPIGAEDDAVWSLDSKGGIEKGFAALNATPRDFAKIGLLVANNGKVGDEQVVPAAWIKRISTPVAEAYPDWMYAAQWWHPPGHETHHDFMAEGVYGQYVYENPANHTVIVKLSDYGAEQDEEELVDVFRSLAGSCT